MTCSRRFGRIVFIRSWKTEAEAVVDDVPVPDKRIGDDADADDQEEEEEEENATTDPGAKPAGCSR